MPLLYANPVLMAEALDFQKAREYRMQMVSKWHCRIRTASIRWK
jgi:hypothetical protein